MPPTLEQSPQIAHNFSQDKISLGASEQPVSLTIIPGKLNDEQVVEMDQIRNLNKDSEQESRQSDNLRGS